MPTIRQRIADLLFRDERKRLTQANDIILDAYLRGPARYHPDDLLRDLKELDSHTLSNLVRDLDYIRLDALSEPTDEDRVRAVMESRYLFRTSPMIEYAIGLWTSFGFGESVDVIPEDESAVKVWNEFWHADRNASVLGDRRLQLLSDQVLRDGERFLALYVSRADGRVTIRSIDSLEITERITAPGDEGTAVWYKREWTEATPSNPSGVRRVLYYPDYRVLAGAATDEDSGEVELGKSNGRSGKRTLEWKGWDAVGQKVTATALLPEGAERADQVNPGTYCCVLPVCHNAKDSWRGWPLMTTGHAWAREHEQFRVNRANVAESTAMFVRELKADTGSRGIAAMKAQMESTLASDPSAWDRNPPPVSGSTFLSNKAVDLRQLSQATGAGDAKEDGQALAWYSLLSARLFPHYAGMGDAYRLATATSMETPILRTFSGYQKFWASVWTDLSRVVLAAATVFDGQTFKTYNVDVNLDRLIETDLPQLSSVMAEFYSGVFGPLQQGGMIPDESVPPIVARTVQMYLTELGLDDVEEIITEETIKAAMEEKKRADEEAQAQAAQMAAQTQQTAPEGDKAADEQMPPEEVAAEYSPDQPRAPEGTSNGGQWISSGDVIDYDQRLRDERERIAQARAALGDWGLKPGTYDGWRGGSMTPDTKRGIFIAPDRESAVSYAKLYRGGTAYVHQVSVTIKNPFIVDKADEAYMRLKYPEHEFTDADWEVSNRRRNRYAKEYERVAFRANDDWVKLDQDVMRLARKAGYDSIVYTKPLLPAMREIVALTAPVETIGTEVVENAGSNGNGHGRSVSDQVQMLAMLEAAERVLSRDGLAGAGAFGVTDAAPVTAYMQEDGADDGE